MSHFYFAWVDPTDTTFSPTFKRDDEDVFSVAIQHAEGDFPSMDVALLNPNVGLLSAGRKQWAWLSWTDDSGTNHPLFFGRLLGAPQSMQDSIISLTFIARPLDYEEQRADLLAAAQAADPVYDPIWIPDEDVTNPDSLLETLPALWHIDRTTLAVTASDIIEGDSTVDFTSTSFYDSLDVRYSDSPASKCVVQATVNWTQRGSGSFPIEAQLIEAFRHTHDTKGLFSARGNPVSGKGMIAVIPGKEMVANWPKPGQTFGGGWFVSSSSVSVIGGPPLDPILVPDANRWLQVKDLLGSSIHQGMALRQVFERSPGFVVQVIPSWVTDSPFGTAHGPVDILWFPIWRLAPKLSVGWDVARPRTETVSFTLLADVQPLLTDPGAEEIINLSIGPADIDAYLDLRDNHFFDTPRGNRAFQSVVARARAALLSRARAVELSFDCTFETAITLSCRMDGVLSDARLPGGAAGGKIKSYVISADGTSGEMIGHVVLGATVGRDGTVTAVPGTAEYVNSTYVVDYQRYVGATASIPGYSDLTYSVDYAVTDDGVNLHSVSASDFLQGIEIDGTIDLQQAAAESVDSKVASAAEVVAKVSGFTTTIKVTMRPISDNSFVTDIVPTLSVLKVPRTIDTETV